MPLASLAQTSDVSTIPPRPKSIKDYPLAQVLYFHEQRLAKLEFVKKETEGTEGTNTKKDTVAEILGQKITHLESVCEQLSKTLAELKEQQNNVTLEVEEE